ncbi:MAG TPA: TonB-dependent receptor [Saprospiraceae bacterium]|nr:TonB-dependent receptor [Saprospiraceae bacterium]
MRYFIYFSLFLFPFFSFAQRKGIISGVLKDQLTQEILIGASVKIQNSNPTIGAVTDLDGRFRIEYNVGSYNLLVEYTGYESKTLYNVDINSGNINVLSVELKPDVKSLQEVTVSANRSIRPSTVETPNSLQRLSMQEIKTSPGGNFDVFKIVQSLPGIASPPGVGNRNDIIMRGGGPSENVYYLDDIEIPTINHFATQGSSGGSNGILNVSFVEELTLNSSSFDAKYDNALSSVFQFKQRDGNRERLQGNLRLSSSELAATVEGPIGPKTNFLSSVRRSYLQYLFEAIDLAIRPNYWDFQYRVKHQLNPKTSITAIGLGALDDFYIDLTKNTSVDNAYIIKRGPTIKQWNYAVGVAAKHLFTNGYWNLAVSRNMSDNDFRIFEDGLRNDPSKQTLGSESQEIENKLRFNLTQFISKWTISSGLSLQYAKYNNAFSQIIRKEIRDSQNNIIQNQIENQFTSAFDLIKIGVSGQGSRRFFDEKLGLSIGLRTDLNSFTTRGFNPIAQLSPRLSLEFAVNAKWRINSSVGSYTKLPAYTILGYQDSTASFINKDVDYIRCNHFVVGTEFIPRASTRITIESFYKRYSNYPVSERNGISLANLGSDFGTIGNEKVNDSGRGQAYGLELFFQQKMIRNFFTFFSYTYVISQFSNAQDKLVASSWDNRHLFSITIGKKFKKNWEIGLKYRFAGGVPYTPFDSTASRINYTTFGEGVLDYSRLNSERLANFNQVDFRIDKKWNFKRATLDVYFDLTNALFLKTYNLPNYVFERKADNSGFVTTDGSELKKDGSNAVPKILSDPQVNFIPSLGFVFEF